LRFTSLAHVPLERPAREGIAQIGYYVQGNGNGDRVVRRSDSLYPYEAIEATARDPILCTDVESLAFFFYTHDGEVKTSWDSASEDMDFASPAAVRIVLEVKADETRRVLQTTVTLPVVRKRAGFSD
jgi:hypothetical protein